MECLNGFVKIVEDVVQEGSIKGMDSVSSDRIAGSPV
jgi:hypothetical protein